MNFQEIDLEQTHIRLTTDLASHDLKRYILQIRLQLKNYMSLNPDFLITMEPITNYPDDLPLIIKTMYESSVKSDVGPMACVAGTISELSLNYLIKNGSKYSIVENGGDIALVNNKKVLCGIYSNNEILGNDIAFEIKPHKKVLGICTSSGKIGHSISFGESDSVTVISDSPALADGLATRIANEVNGESSEDKVTNACEVAENFKEFYNGILIISDENIATIGKLPKIVETNEFNVNSINWSVYDI